MQVPVLAKAMKQSRKQVQNFFIVNLKKLKTNINNDNGNENVFKYRNDNQYVIRYCNCLCWNINLS